MSVTNVLKHSKDGRAKEMTRKSTIMVTDKLEFFTDSWVMEDPVGEPGAFGVAYICHRKTDQSKTKFVVKQISKARFYHIDRRERDLILENMSNEIKLQKTLHHTNICLLYEVYEDRNYIHLVMDYLEGGELFERICEEEHFSEDKAAKIAEQILEAIRFMHSKNICHLDLKPDNILFEDKSEQAPIKVIDFGMAQVVPRLKKLKQTVGTPYYTAPEVLGGAYDRAADIWSIGVMMYCMLFGYPPFYVDSDDIKLGESEEDAIYELVKKGFTPEVLEGYGPWFPEDLPVSDEAKDLIGKMLRYNVSDRLTAAEALDHPWIRNKVKSKKLPRTVYSSLVNFNSTNRFKLLVSRMFAKHMEPERYAETLEVFKKWDTDGDGEITLSEFRKGMREATTLSEKEIDTIFKHLDKDDSRTITIDELIIASAFDALVAVDERMFDEFAKLDEDGDGQLEISELKKALTQFNAKDLGRAESILAEIDTDFDGKIDYEEFLRALHPALNEPTTEDMTRLRSKGFGSMNQNMFNKFVYKANKEDLVKYNFDPDFLKTRYHEATQSGELDLEVFVPPNTRKPMGTIAESDADTDIEATETDHNETPHHHPQPNLVLADTSSLSGNGLKRVRTAQSQSTTITTRESVVDGLLEEAPHTPKVKGHSSNLRTDKQRTVSSSETVERKYVKKKDKSKNKKQKHKDASSLHEDDSQTIDEEQYEVGKNPNPENLPTGCIHCIVM